MNEAQNLLSPEARTSAMRMRLIDKMEGIIRESARPMERIESIKILQVDGLGGGGGHRGDDDGSGSGGGFADSVVNSALRYRAQAPLVDQLLREIGVEGGDVGKLARGLLDRGPSARAGIAERRAGAAGLVIKVYTSSVVDASAEAVWAHVRDFNGLAEVDAVRCRVAHRGRAARGPRRLRAPLSPEGRRHHPRAAADAFRLRPVVHLRDPRKPDGSRELRGDVEAHAGHRRHAHVRRMVGRVRLRTGARGGAHARDRHRRVPGGVRQR